jgi:hypothetical protein
MMKFLLWSVPLLVIPAGCLCSRYVPLRKFRYWLYALVLIAAFVLNLAQVSFRDHVFDTVELMAVSFICAEWFWRFFKVKDKKIFRTLFVLALCVYLFGFRHWLAAGPGHAVELWKALPAGVYNRGGDVYAVRERVLHASLWPAREIVLSKRFGTSPFEKQMKSYRTPRGFGSVVVTYVWSETPEGILLDIHAAGRRLWTMGEGF